MKYFASFIFAFTIVQLLAQAGTINYELITADEDRMGYFEHVPDAYSNNASATYPLILFLHGRGERDMGNPDDLKKILRWGPPRIVAHNQPAYKTIHPYRFIILAPQLKAPDGNWKAEDIDAFLKFALKNYRIDQNRIYLTGISMGGNGVWNYAYSPYNEPNKLAAIAPIAAWGNPANGCKVVERNIPVWAFHGLKDAAIPFSSGQAMYSSLGKCGESLDIRKYRFSPVNTDHTAWPAIYGSDSDSLSVYDWFMSFTLASDTIKDEEKRNWSAPPYIDSDLTQVGTLPAELNENSGLVVDTEGRIWTHNDSGNKAEIFEIDTTGKVIRTLHVGYTTNQDWEDVAMDKLGNLYIGDIGNNLNTRNKLLIYKVAKKELENEIPSAETITFMYEDQHDFPPSMSEMHYDAESLIHYDGSLYIFTKNRTEPFTGYTHIYRIPDTPGEYTAELVDSLKLGEGVMTNYWLTSADISPSGNQIALLSHDKVWILRCIKGKKFSEGQLTELRLNSYTQKEGVTFLDETTLIISDERIKNILGGNLYRLNLPPESQNSCD